MNHVIIMGSRGYTKNYGGWETLVHGMLNNWKDKNTTFYVTEVANDDNEPEFETINGIHCIRVRVKKGGTEMVEANIKVLNNLPRYIKHFHMENPILYVLGPRVGFYFWLKKPMFKRYNVFIVKNSDGMGWLRGKYNAIQKFYMKLNGPFFNKYVMNYLVADAQEMARVYERLIEGNKHLLGTKVIYYGTDEAPVLPEAMPEKVKEYFDKHGIVEDKYYLIINRLVPENSYELILKQFIESKTDCDFIVVTNQEKEKAFFEKLRTEIPFEQDKRVKFVGTVYDKEILAWLRQKARGYINGHTLGGTNPGLLEALASTNVNLIRDCPFSREGAADLGFYFDEAHPLSEAIAKVDAMPFEERKALGDKAKERMRTLFSWDYVDSQYVELFNEINSKRGSIK